MAFSFYYSFRDESGVRRFLPYRLARAARHARTASPCGCAVAWRRAQTQDSHAVVGTRFVHENNHDAVGWFEHKPPERTAPQSVQIGHAATGGSLRRTRAAGPALVRGSLLRRTRNRRAGGDEPTMAGRRWRPTAESNLCADAPDGAPPSGNAKDALDTVVSDDGVEHR